ncbi:hypothetical protein N0V88_007845 [Collariella sp. IMI 366227]|nr:hypothetical protein N0V88_007845 [Collariella sp. IMI 366227]
MRSLAALLAVGAAVIAPASATNPDPPNCPTITQTAFQCSSCVVPACLVMSTVTKNCGCPDKPETRFLSFPCDMTKRSCGGCATTYSIVTATGCSTTSSNAPPPTSTTTTSKGSTPTPTSTKPPTSTSDDCDSTTVTIPTTTKTTTKPPLPTSTDTDDCDTTTTTTPSHPPPPRPPHLRRRRLRRLP